MDYRKIAIISDIHANLQMLSAFIRYIDEEKIDLVLNLGDFISNGPHPCEVADLIFKDKRFINIKGYDEETLFHTLRISEGIGIGEWTRNKLGNERIEKIRKLPNTRMIIVQNKKILMTHINGWAEIAQKVAHGQKSKITNNEYDYIFNGGSHTQELIYSKKPFFASNIIDPGALLMDEEERGNFVVMDFTKEKPHIIFQSIKGDKKAITKVKERSSDTKEIELLEETMLHIYSDKKNDKGKLILKDEVIQRVLEIGIKESKYVLIGCWAHEKIIIKEILFNLKCRYIKKSENSEQEWYVGEITPEIAKLILENRKLPCSRIKWFEISFQDSLYSMVPAYSIYHYGGECLLRKLTTKDLYSIQEMLKNYEVPYNLPVS